MGAYEAYRIAVDSGNIEALKTAFPKHWMVTGIKPTMTKRELAFSDVFPEAYEMREVDEWVSRAYILSGKHSYEQLVVYIPAGTPLRLEYENHELKHAWITNNGVGIDVAHNVPFIESIPHDQNPMKSGSVHGVLLEQDGVDIGAELQKVDTSEVIPKLNFMVCYIIDNSVNSMLASLETCKLIGFTVAVHVPATINKWDAVKKSASLAIGSGALGYECYKILMMHDDYRLIDKLQGKDINRWGFVAHIKHPRMLGEIKQIDWRTEVFENKIVVIPHILFSYNNELLFNIGVPDLTKSTDGIAELRATYADIISGKYRIGDVVAFIVEDQKFVSVVLEVRGKSASVTPSGCPKCGYMLDVWVDKVICTNPKCVELIRNNIQTWVSAYGPMIDERVLLSFITAFSVLSIADIYTTFDKGDVADEWYPRLHEAVNDSRDQGMGKFLTIICQKITDVEGLRIDSFAHGRTQDICGVRISQLVDVTGMTVDKAEEVVEWIERNRVWFKHTLDAFVGDEIRKNKLFGKTFIISGLLYERDKLSMEGKIREVGGRVIDTSKGKGVDYIIAGRFADEKMINRAKELHVPPIVIHETSFQDFIKDCAKSA